MMSTVSVRNESSNVLNQVSEEKMKGYLSCYPHPHLLTLWYT